MYLICRNLLTLNLLVVYTHDTYPFMCRKDICLTCRRIGFGILVYWVFHYDDLRYCWNLQLAFCIIYSSIMPALILLLGQKK